MTLAWILKSLNLKRFYLLINKEDLDNNKYLLEINEKKEYSRA